MIYHTPNIRFTFCAQYTSAWMEGNVVRFYEILQVGKPSQERMSTLCNACQDAVWGYKIASGATPFQVDLIRCEVLKENGWVDWCGFEIPF